VTEGLAVSWQFVYGTTTQYSAGTPVQAIPAGGATSVTVSQTLNGLQPSTTYHYKVMETVSDGPYAPGTTVSGQDLTFTTNSPGKILLGHTRLPVSPNGGVAVPLICRSSLACVGRFSITTQTEIGRGSARHRGSVVCDTTFTRLAANHRRNVKVTLATRCLALLQSAAGHRLSAKFTTRPRSGQLGLSKKITLVGH
jgi:hypothetical protein